jgi:hypothetical protein
MRFTDMGRGRIANPEALAAAVPGWRTAPSANPSGGWSHRYLTLEDLGNLGDFVGGLAVIATLLYLAVQIRQNTRILRTSAEQTADPIAAIANIAQSPENAEVYHRGLVDPLDLSEAERTHFYLLMASSFYVLHQGYRAYQLGTQTRDTWQWQSRALQFYAGQPGVREWWRKQGHALFASESEFWSLVDSEMRKQGAPAA